MTDNTPYQLVDRLGDGAETARAPTSSSASA
jgi:hypothetical protein